MFGISNAFRSKPQPPSMTIATVRLVGVIIFAGILIAAGLR